MRIRLAVLSLVALVGAAAVERPVQAQEPPRLVVIISIDQMRSDYIDRYGPRWTGGLKRLVSEGARFVQAAYPYLNTVTCAGHATKPMPFVEAFVKGHPLDRDGEWTKLLPPDAYLDEDEGEGEQAPAGWTRSFPHPVVSKMANGQAVSNWASTPRADAYLARFALTAVDELKMGQTPGTDYLGVSFSVLDSVGHAFGPRSHEVQDVLFQLDRTIGGLLAELDRRVGAGRYVVALTADHGVAPVPEQATALSLDSGRVDLRTVAAKIEAVLGARFGSAKYVARIAYTDLYFAPGVFDKLRADETAMREVIDAVSAVPGISRVLRSDHLMHPEASDDPVVRAARLSQFSGRSGDLILVPKAYWLMSTGTTTHGTSYGYDQHVPVVLFGAGIKSGRYWGAASPADIAPTLAALCGITMARTDGRVLAEALTAIAAAPPPQPTASR